MANYASGARATRAGREWGDSCFGTPIAVITEAGHTYVAVELNQKVINIQLTNPPSLALGIQMN